MDREALNDALKTRYDHRGTAVREDSLKDTFNGCIDGILRLRSEGATAVKIGPIAVVFGMVPADASWDLATKDSDPAYDSAED